MNLRFLVTLFVSSIICGPNQKTFGKVYKKVDKSMFDVKVTDKLQEIILTLKSKDFIPVYGTWYSGEKKIQDGDDYFMVGNENVLTWLLSQSQSEQMMNNLLSLIDKQSYVLNIDKYNFDKDNSDLECVIAVVKVEVLKKITMDLLNNLKGVSDFEQRLEMTLDAGRKLRPRLIEYGIQFPNNPDKTPNFKEYEVVAYKDIDLIDEFKPPALLKKSGIDVLTHILTCVGIFGALIFAGRYSLSKYF